LDDGVSSWFGKASFDPADSRLVDAGQEAERLQAEPAVLPQLAKIHR
jgi:hypothetical protein